MVEVSWQRGGDYTARFLATLFVSVASPIRFAFSLVYTESQQSHPSQHSIVVGLVIGTLVGTTGLARSTAGLAVVIVSADGCRRTRVQILARDCRDPAGGVEQSEGPHESAAAIGCNHRHDVHVVAKKL